MGKVALYDAVMPLIWHQNTLNRMVVALSRGVGNSLKTNGYPVGYTNGRVSVDSEGTTVYNESLFTKVNLEQRLTSTRVKLLVDKHVICKPRSPKMGVTLALGRHEVIDGIHYQDGEPLNDEAKYRPCDRFGCEALEYGLFAFCILKDANILYDARYYIRTLSDVHEDRMYFFIGNHISRGQYLKGMRGVKQERVAIRKIKHSPLYEKSKTYDVIFQFDISKDLRSD